MVFDKTEGLKENVENLAHSCHAKENSVLNEERANEGESNENSSNILFSDICQWSLTLLGI